MIFLQFYNGLVRKFTTGTFNDLIFISFISILLLDFRQTSPFDTMYSNFLSGL